MSHVAALVERAEALVERADAKSLPTCAALAFMRGLRGQAATEAVFLEMGTIADRVAVWCGADPARWKAAETTVDLGGPGARAALEALVDGSAP